MDGWMEGKEKEERVCNTSKPHSTCCSTSYSTLSRYSTVFIILFY